jgi:hypothetical protein
MEGVVKIKDEQIISAFIIEIRTILDRALNMAFFTNYRIILVDLETSNSPGVDIAMGPIFWLIKDKKIEFVVKKLVREAKSSIELISKNNKKVIEIRYEKVTKIDCKYEREYEIPILKIYYAEPLVKSKNQIKIAVLPYRSYRKEIIKGGLKAGNLSIDFGKDFRNIIRPFLGDKLTVKVK